MADATLTVTVEGNPQMDRTEKYKVILDWLSATGGAVSINIAATYAAAQKAIGYAMPQPSKLQGYIKAIETIPGALGIIATATPDNDYDITLDDEYDYDVAGGNLADRADDAAETIIPASPIPIDSEITLEITGAGDEKKGRIILFIDPGV